MSRAGGLFLAVVAASWAPQAGAATAYVSDELVLGVYAEPNGQGQRLATLHSGANLETLSVNGEFTQVRLSDATTGWVKTSYLTTLEPATARLKQLQDELDRSRATTPALAEAAARSEVEQLKRELKDLQSALDAARGAVAGAAPGAQASPGAVVGGVPALAPQSVAGPAGAGMLAALAAHPLSGVMLLLLLLACGFWAGYATLARRVKHKFGGIKVY